MDPQSVVFHPQSEFWRFQNELQRLQAVQAEHSDRLLRVERKQDEDARMKSVWGGASPFPGILSGTPQQTPLHQPTADAFKNFEDEESADLIGSLHLDAEEEPRRMGATSRANSVRFDESANQGHWSHTSRSSMDLMRSAGGVPMGERTSSHKSDGRASSVHSMRSAASGRANSLNMDTGYSFGDSNRSPIENPGLAPGLLLLGSVPAIIRCWMNTDFKHNALMYAAVCTGSYRSFLDRRLIEKLGFTNRIVTSTSGLPTVTLAVYLPEAIPHPASARSGSPAPQLPTLSVTFTVFSPPSLDVLESKGIQIILGSDTLRIHNADILFSTNRMSLFDDERNKLSIPLVRPEDEKTFSGLSTKNIDVNTETRLDQLQQELLNGLGQRSSGESVPSLSSSGIIGSQRTNTATGLDLTASTGPSDSSEDEKVPRTGRSIRFASVRDSSADPEVENALMAGDGEQQRHEPTRTSSSPAIWNNWRQRGPDQPQAAVMDYASASKQREPAQRKESGMKVLRPMKATTRSFSGASSSPNPGGDAKSRYFDDGKKKGPAESLATEQRREESPSAEPVSKDSPGQGSPLLEQGGKARVNPAGGASAFSWLKASGAK